MKTKYRYIVLLFLFCLPATAFAIKTLGSLPDSIVNAPHDTIKARLLNVYVSNIIRNQPDSAVLYSVEALEIAENFNLVYEQCASFNNIAICFYYKGDYVNSMKYYLELKALRERLGEPLPLANCYNNIGALFSDLGNFDKALEFFFKSLEIAKSIDDIVLQSRNYNNIGLIYYSLGQYDLSLDCFQKSLDFKDPKINIVSLAQIYNNIGEVYRLKNEYNTAIEYYIKSLDICQEIADDRGIATAYSNIGLTNKYLGKYEMAELYFIRSLNIKKTQGNLNGIAQVYYYMGELNFRQSNYDKAISYLDSSLAVADQIDAKALLQDIYETFYIIWEKKKDTDKAFHYYKLYTEAKDSIFNLEASEMLTNYQVQYETIDKEKEIEILNKEKLLKELEVLNQQAEISFRNKVIYFSIAGLLLIAFFVVLLYINMKHKKKANHELAMRNEEISMQKEEIMSIAEKLEIANEELEKLSIVASETDNSVMILDSTGKIEWANSCLLGKYELSQDEFIKNTNANIQNYSSHPKIIEVVQQCVSKRETVIYESLTVPKFKEAFWSQTTLTPIFEKDGSVTKMIAIDSDITKLKKAETEIQKQSDLLKKKNQQITDSIDYAKRIQEAVLPLEKTLKTLLPESFILFKPRDIVSGDFYWFTAQEGKLFIAAADCTGHGVPGAFMSIIGNNLLDDIIIDKQIFEPAEILNRLHTRTQKALNSGDEKVMQDDGMDITICVVDWEKSTIEIACANHFAYVVYGNMITTIKGEPNSIGEKQRQTDSPVFSSTVIELKKGTVVYMFSDGFQDQFGGKENRKFMGSRFKETLFENHNLSMDEQKQKLEQIFMDWKDDMKQIDDVLVIGLKF